MEPPIFTMLDNPYTLKVGDVKPGQLFRLDSSIGGGSCLYLKLYDQKVVNLLSLNIAKFPHLEDVLVVGKLNS